MPTTATPTFGGPRPLSRWWLVLAAGLSLVWLSGAATESLWVDELHTSWTVAGGWSEIAPRAKQGNQSPLFFWILQPLVETLGKLPGTSVEWRLRFVSLLAAVATLVTCLRISSGWERSVPIQASSLVAIALWLNLDRIQLFYATEARAYALVALVSLWGWCAVWRATREQASAAAQVGWLWCWCGLSVCLVFLHITAALAILWQWVWGTVWLWPKGSAVRRQWTLATGAVLAAGISAWWLAARVWEHRYQWSEFAGGTSLSAVLQLFPLLAYGVPVLFCSCLDAWGDFGKLNSRPAAAATWARWRGMWLLAVSGPWMSAWLITAVGVAPVFHRRFVIVSAVPLIVLAAAQLAGLRQRWWRGLSLVGVTVWLVLGQGTWQQWRDGYCYGWQRWEGWRQAAQALSQDMTAADQLWCASGLVEASAATVPLTEEFSEYLSFPLRGAYAVTVAGQPVVPRGLLNSGASWAEQILAAGHNSAEPSGNIWIVYRGSPVGLQGRLKAMREQLEQSAPDQWTLLTPQAFGLVQLVQLQRLR